MLGETKSTLDKIILAMSIPKLETSYYNENGLKVFTNKYSMIFFWTMVISLIVFAVNSVTPVFSDVIIKTEFDRS